MAFLWDDEARANELLLMAVSAHPTFIWTVCHPCLTLLLACFDDDTLLVLEPARHARFSSAG